ncbi:MAG TPA: IgGFc-binding protein [Candidatus Kapabacteria bacterium]|nr:IgGFc-binding protein [Candidatus Kapabacteria bacterium]
MKKNFITILFTLFIIISNTIAQNNALLQIPPIDTIAQHRLQLKNPEGTEFWLTFMKNYTTVDNKPAPINLELFITSEEDANVQIEIKALKFQKNVKVTGKTVQNIKIDTLAQITSSEIIEPAMSVHITSDYPVSVYGLNRRFQTTDTYIGLPTRVLGTVYRVMAYTMAAPLLPELAVVATENNTFVTITPTVETIVGHPAKKPFQVTLNRGDVYQVFAKQDLRAGEDVDLTGTLITANHPIAVFGGHQCAYVPHQQPPITACNHLVEQMPPISSWGKHYFIGKFNGRSYYTWRILANEDSTKVFINSQLIGILNAGEWREGNSKDNIQIRSDKPILVAQFSQGFKNGDNLGDPCMILISPTQQFLMRYRFATPINGEWNHYVTVVIPTRALNTLRLDNAKAPTYNFEEIGITRYSIGSIQIDYGTHSLEAAMPFGMYSYGFGYGNDSYDAYGNMGGQSFVDYEPANDTIPPSIEFIADKDRLRIIIRDDREFDTGINDIIFSENQNLSCAVPKYSEGVPQLELTITPSTYNSGRVILKVNDIAQNENIQTICYSLNASTGFFEFNITPGYKQSCNPYESLQIGAFINPGYLFHSVNFINSGNINPSNFNTQRVLGEFQDKNASNISFGVLATYKIANKLYGTAKINLESFSGKLDATDNSVSHYRDPITNYLVPFQEGRTLELKGMNMGLYLQAEYFFLPMFYVLGGVSTYINLSKSIDYSSRIITPNYLEYTPSQIDEMQSRMPKKLSSLNALNFSGFIGMGFSYPLRYNLKGFIEGYYQHYFFNLIDDGDWKVSKISLLFGIKYYL